MNLEMQNLVGPDEVLHSFAHHRRIGTIESSADDRLVYMNLHFVAQARIFIVELFAAFISQGFANPSEDVHRKRILADLQSKHKRSLNRSKMHVIIGLSYATPSEVLHCQLQPLIESCFFRA